MDERQSDVATAPEALEELDLEALDAVTGGGATMFPPCTPTAQYSYCKPR